MEKINTMKVSDRIVSMLCIRIYILTSSTYSFNIEESVSDDIEILKKELRIVMFKKRVCKEIKLYTKSYSKKCFCRRMYWNILLEKSKQLIQVKKRLLLVYL